MGLFIFLTVLQAIVAAALVGVVLMQRSEGGGLGIGGSPTGALGARGAADFLTRATKWLAIAFVALSITLAAVAVETSSADEISSTVERGADDVIADDGDLLGGSDTSPSNVDLLGGSEQSADAPASDDPIAE